MNKWWIGLIVVLILVAGLGYKFYPTSPQSPLPQTQPTTVTPSPTPEIVDIKASFTIITGNITRNFSSPKYHNQSADVFIQADDPTTIHVKKSGITWSDFFKTLPISLTKVCLTTGDGEKLCNDKGTLKFYLNDVEDPNLLDKEIKDDDKLLISYKSS